MHMLYNRQSGEIIGHFICPDYMLDLNIQNIPEWQGSIEYTGIIDGGTHYFDLINTIRLRPEILAEPNKLTMAADNVDSIIIAGLPIPCTVAVDGAEYLVDDGEFEFTTDVSGIYKIAVESFPYIPKSWEVTAE